MYLILSYIYLGMYAVKCHQRYIGHNFKWVSPRGPNATHSQYSLDWGFRSCKVQEWEDRESYIISDVFYSYFFVMAICIKSMLLNSSFYALDRSLEIQGLKICVAAMKSPGKAMRNHSTKCWSFRFSHCSFILKWFCVGPDI